MWSVAIQIRLRSYSSSLEQPQPKGWGSSLITPHSLFFSSPFINTWNDSACFALYCLRPSLKCKGPWWQKPCLSDSLLPLQTAEQCLAWAHSVNMCSQWMNESIHWPRCFLQQGMEKEEAHPHGRWCGVFIRTSDLWNHVTQIIQSSQLCIQNDKEVKGASNQDHKFGDLEATVLGSSRTDGSSPHGEKRPPLTKCLQPWRPTSLAQFLWEWAVSATEHRVLIKTDRIPILSGRRTHQQY